MRKITIVQRNWDGRGSDRTHAMWVKPDQVAHVVQRKSMAYNMDHTTITVS